MYQNEYKQINITDSITDNQYYKSIFDTEKYHKIRSRLYIVHVFSNYHAFISAGWANRIIGQKLSVCWCVCVLTTVAQITTVARRVL